jgi:hypothetical protein
VFSVLEAMLPPLLTLSTAYVLKELLLNIIEQRHTDQNAYEFVLMEWERSTVNPEQHPQFVQAYANELRDALIKSNRRRKVAREMMEQLASVEWKTLVKRELQTEEWFTATDYDHEEESVITETPLS